MTNDEMWAVEIERLRRLAAEAQRRRIDPDDGMGWVEAGSALERFREARKARFECQDYLVWKLTR